MGLQHPEVVTELMPELRVAWSTWPIEAVNLHAWSTWPIEAVNLHAWSTWPIEAVNLHAWSTWPIEAVNLHAWSSMPGVPACGPAACRGPKPACLHSSGQPFYLHVRGPQGPPATPELQAFCQEA